MYADGSVTLKANASEKEVGLISPERQSRRTGATLPLVAAVSLFGVMDGLGEFLAADFPLPQLIWARFAFAIPIILATTAPGGWLKLLHCERPLLQAARGVLPLLASLTVLVGLRFLDLADDTAITFAAPLFVVALSAPILRERVGATAWIGMGLGFLGVLLVARHGASSIAWAALLPMATAFLLGLYQVLTRLASRSDAPATTLAWTIVAGFALTTPFLTLGWSSGSLTSWLLLILSGLLFGAGHLLLIRAFAAAPAWVAYKTAANLQPRSVKFVDRCGERQTCGTKRIVWISEAMGFSSSARVSYADTRSALHIWICTTWPEARRRAGEQRSAGSDAKPGMCIAACAAPAAAGRAPSPNCEPPGSRNRPARAPCWRTVVEMKWEGEDW
jgi:drug/metabolite transporter (DMT)-like permease